MRIVLVLLCVLLDISVWASEQKSSAVKFVRVEIFPADQVPDSFKGYRKVLQESVRKKDKKKLSELVAGDILFSFGARGQGKKHFLDYWFSQGREEKLWQELSKLLDLAATEQPNGDVCVPYFFCSEKLPAAYAANPDTWFVTGKDIPLRELKTPQSKIVKTLTYEFVQVGIDEEVDKETSVKVLAGDGASGFIERQHLRKLSDYRAFFKRTQNKWLMTSFIAGD